MQQIGMLGYLVIEFPDIVRHVGEQGLHPASDDGESVPGWCYSKADLRETTNSIIGVIAGQRGAGGRGRKRVDGFFARGVGRWHWFGDKARGKYNPHFNVLVDFGSLLGDVREELQPVIEAYKAGLEKSGRGRKVRRELQSIEMYQRGRSGYMPKPLLDKIVADLRDALGCPELIVHYSYKDKPGQIVQTVRYVTRATFREYSWEKYMAEQLYGFRNTRWWGSWTGEAVWELEQAEAEGEDTAGLEAVSSLQGGVCPDCGRPLRMLHHSHETGRPVYWTKPVDSIYLDIWGAQEIAGTGYYRIPWQAHNPKVMSPEELIRLQELETKARERPSVHPWAVAMRQSADVLWRNTRTYKRMFRRRVLEEQDEDEHWRELLEDGEGEDVDVDDEAELLGRVDEDGPAIQPKAECGGDRGGCDER